MMRKDVSMRGLLRVAMGCALACVLGSGGYGCYEGSTPPQTTGGETHFLSACAADDECRDGLSCLCGICSIGCKRTDDCADLHERASCEAPSDPGGTPACASAAHTEADRPMCELRCEDDEDACGTGLVCRDGVCRPKRESAKPPVTEEEEPAPLVLFLVDTSGSMERLPDCTCTTSSCTECLPRCGVGQPNDQNRWATLLSALTGSFEHFECESLERTEENGATYDLGESLPFHRVTQASVQRDDGVFDVYASQVRLGLATFDAMDTYKGSPPLIELESFSEERSADADGMYSYGPVRAFRYPSLEHDYAMDTGIRSRGTFEGALQYASTLAQSRELAPSMQQSLRAVRPYGGTPIAAALDDLRHLFDGDADRSARGAGVHVGAKRYVVLITDGMPDLDYRDFGCDCQTREECKGEDPATMRCPYPTAVAASRALVCGEDTEACSEGVIDALYVVTVSLKQQDEPEAIAELDAVAAQGTTERARISTPDNLREVLDEVMREIKRDSAD